MLRRFNLLTTLVCCLVLFSYCSITQGQDTPAAEATPAAETTPDLESGVSAEPMPEAPTAWTPYVAVDDLEASASTLRSMTNDPLYRRHLADRGPAGLEGRQPRRRRNRQQLPVAPQGPGPRREALAPGGSAVRVDLVVHQPGRAGRRAELHRRIGLALEAGYDGASDEIAASLADHFVEGVDPLEPHDARATADCRCCPVINPELQCCSTREVVADTGLGQHLG